MSGAVLDLTTYSDEELKDEYREALINRDTFIHLVGMAESQADQERRQTIVDMEETFMAMAVDELKQRGIDFPPERKGEN